MSRPKRKDYRHAGGVIRLPRAMLGSPAYRSLSPAARALLVELQLLWAPDRTSIHFSSRRAGEALGISKASAARAFRELVETEFVVVTDEAQFSSNGTGKARCYRLTWESMGGREPTAEWQTAEISRSHP